MIQLFPVLKIFFLPNFNICVRAPVSVGPLFSFWPLNWHSTLDGEERKNNSSFTRQYYSFSCNNPMRCVNCTSNYCFNLPFAQNQNRQWSYRFDINYKDVLLFHWKSGEARWPETARFTGTALIQLCAT